MLAAALASFASLPVLLAASSQAELNRVSLVVAPSAYCAAVFRAAVADGDTLLIVGQRGLADRQLSVFRLDKSGMPATDPPAPIVLPRPDGLKEFAHYPISIVMHPRLPLVYVWQDVAAPPAETIAQRPALGEFDHLHVFRLEGALLKPAGSFGRGPEYSHANTIGTLAIDSEGKRLFLPNLRDEAGQKAIGYFDLDAAGAPLKVPVPTPGNLDGFGLDKFEMQLRPHRVTIGADCGGLMAASAQVVVFGTAGGVAFWDTENRRGALGYLYVPQTPGLCLIGGDRTPARIFGVAHEGGDALLSIAHAGGYLTLVPQVVQLGSTAHLRSAPVVMSGKTKRVAVGGINAVHLIPFTGDKLAGAAATLPVQAPSLRALAYSRAHDRLYVAVEKLP